MRLLFSILKEDGRRRNPLSNVFVYRFLGWQGGACLNRTESAPCAQFLTSSIPKSVGVTSNRSQISLHHRQAIMEEGEAARGMGSMEPPDEQPGELFRRLMLVLGRIYVRDPSWLKDADIRRPLETILSM